MTLQRDSPPGRFGIPDTVLPLFLSAGWSPRDKPTAAPDEHPAASILRALGGLRVAGVEAGEECGASDLHFDVAPQMPDGSRVLTWERLLDTQLRRIAELDGGHGELWMASDGRCFGNSHIHDAFSFEGETFGETVERLLLGRRARPLIGPHQDVVSMYGKDYRRSDSEVYLAFDREI